MTKDDFIKSFAAIEHDVLITCYEASKNNNKSFSEMLLLFAQIIKEDANNKDLLNEFIKDNKR